jgi:two-component system sensor histidine kinase KdpD
MVVGVAGIVAVTVVIEILKSLVPVLSLGALYVFAVLPVAVFSGTAAAVIVAVASMLAFNFFFLPPLYTFTLADPNNWLSLLVFLVTAVVVSELASRSRRRATESELLAQIATSLLEHGQVSEELDRIAEEAARVLEVQGVRIELGEPGSPPDGDMERLTAGGRLVGTIYLDQPLRPGRGARRRLLPGLASLLGVAIDRERLQRDAYEAEALRRSDALKTALLRSVSHDLRSPLMTILTSASALERGDLALDQDDRRDLLAAIHVEAERLDRFVSNLLDLSRLQAGAADPAPAVCSLDDLVVHAMSEIGDSSRIDVTLADDGPSVRADAHQIERVLANLIENALKYSPIDEHVAVHVGGAGGEAIVRVIDRGPGIPASELQSIFEPFQRGSATGGARGAGLGLAIARGFAEANGGRLWAESRAGQGATFALALPVAAEVEVAL